MHRKDAIEKWRTKKTEQVRIPQREKSNEKTQPASDVIYRTRNAVHDDLSI